MQQVTVNRIITTLSASLMLTFCQQTPLQKKEKVSKRTEPVAQIKNGKTNQGSGRLTVRVLTPENRPLNGVKVKLLHREFLTDGGGFAALSNLPRTSFLLRFSRYGYADGFINVRIGAKEDSLLKVYLVRHKTLELKDMTRRNKIRKANIEIEIPGGTFVNKQGKVVRQAQLDYKPLRVTGPELHAMPGGFRGTLKTGRELDIESFGAASIQVIDYKTGEELQIAKGKFLILRMPYQGKIPRGAKTALLWSLNEKTGKWAEEMRGKLIRKNGKFWVEAKLPHLSWWNIDAPFVDKSSIWIQSFKDETGTYLFTPQLSGRGISYNGISRPFDYYGKATLPLPGRCIDVKRGSEVEILADFIAPNGRIYQYKKKIRAKNLPSSCRVNPKAGVVIKELSLEKLALTCVRGKIALIGNKEPLQAELYMMNQGHRDERRVSGNRDSAPGDRQIYFKGNRLIHKGPINKDGSFCFNHVPVKRDAWLYFIGGVSRSLEKCDREQYAVFPISLPESSEYSCETNRNKCVNLGLLKGRMSKGRCRKNN